MAKEEKILTVRSKLNDRDFEDVFKIYLETERTKDKSIGLLTCGVLCIVCIILMILLHTITFLFYALGCVIIAVSYMLVPVNKKFIANNKLQFGEWRETTFYPHSVSVMEIFEENERETMDEEEIEEATTDISTVSLTAYENERGFLFADGKIVNQFLYIPKRGLKKQEIADIQEFAKERCSGGYTMLEMNSMIEEEETDEEETGTAVTSAVCEQFYSAKKLHLYNAEGHRVDFDGDDEHHENEEDAQKTKSDDLPSDVPELNVDEEWERIISEDAEGEEHE